MTEKEMQPLLVAIATINKIEEKTTSTGKKLWFIKATDLDDMQEISVSMFDENQKIMLGIYEGTGKSVKLYFRQNGDYKNYEKHEAIPGETPTPKDSFKPSNITPPNTGEGETGGNTPKSINDRIWANSCVNNATTIVAQTMGNSSQTYLEEYPDKVVRTIMVLAKELDKQARKWVQE